MGVASPPPGFFLLQGEQPRLSVGAAPRYAIARFLELAARLVVGSAVVVALALLLEFLPDALAYVVAGAFPVLAAGLYLVAVAQQRSAEYVVTDERVYARRGRLLTRVHFAPLDRITDMRYEQGPFDRALGLSSLTVMTAGGDVAFTGLSDATAARHAIESAREALLEGLLSRVSALPAAAQPTVAASEVPEPMEVVETPAFVQPGDRALWVARPRPIASLASVRGLGGALPLVLFLYVARGPYPALTALGILLGATLMFLAVRFAAQRRAVYVATDRRVYARTGLFGTTIAQLTYDKITDVTYKQDVLGRLLGYGSITLTTAGGAPPVTLAGLRDATAAKERIERLRARALRGTT